MYGDEAQKTKGGNHYDRREVGNGCWSKWKSTRRNNSPAAGQNKSKILNITCGWNMKNITLET